MFYQTIYKKNKLKLEEKTKKRLETSKLIETKKTENKCCDIL